MITIMICLLFIIGCDGILNSEDKRDIFVVKKIGNSDIKSDTIKELFKNRLYPVKFTFTNIENHNYQGEVKFDSVGTFKIRNATLSNSFSTEVGEYYIEKGIRYVVFNGVHISNDTLRLGFYYAGPFAPSMMPYSLTAVKK